MAAVPIMPGNLSKVLGQVLLTQRGIEGESFEYSEALAQRCSVKKVFLEISQNSQENTCARASF